MTKRWVILGGTSAIGRAYAHQVAQQGHALTLVGRNLQELKKNATDIAIRYQVNTEVYVCDFSRPRQFLGLIQYCKAYQENLNLIFSYGFLPSEPVISTQKLEQCVNINFTSVAQLINLFLPLLMIQKDAHIVVLSSIAGDRGRASNACYGASKAALSTYLCGLRGQLKNTTVSLTTVKPGFVDTPMTYGMQRLPFLVSPEDLSQAILKATLKKKASLYYPSVWRGIAFIIRSLPERLLHYLNL